MSFGYSIGDAVLLTQLAWRTVQNARKACGEHNELTQEVLSLHVVLRRLEREVEKPENPFNCVRSCESDKEELLDIVNRCQKILSVLNQVLTKYNSLSEQERSGKRLWQKIKFGNGKMTELSEMRARLTYYTSAMSFLLSIMSMSTMGRVERQINDAGGDLKEIKTAVNGITAHLMSSSNRHEGSVLTAYADDDRAVWKEFRRELLEGGFSSSVIQKHKRLIKAYIEELGSRGLFDEEDSNMDVEEHCCEVDSAVERATAYMMETEKLHEALSKIVSKIVSEGESEGESVWIWSTDENASLWLHSMWHELFDDIVQRLIEWGVLPFHERRETDLSPLIDRFSRLRAEIKCLAVPVHLSASKAQLLGEIVNVGAVMKEHQRASHSSKWTDERCGGLGSLVELVTSEDKNIDERDVYVRTGAQFCFQLDADGVCRQRGRKDGELREEGYLYAMPTPPSRINMCYDGVGKMISAEH